MNNPDYATRYSYFKISDIGKNGFDMLGLKECILFN